MNYVNSINLNSWTLVELSAPRFDRITIRIVRVENVMGRPSNRIAFIEFYYYRFLRDF